MNYEHPKRDLLLAFVDGRLDVEQADEAATLIDQDPSAAQFVSLLSRSLFPYSESFGSLLTLPLPKKVVSIIETAEIESHTDQGEMTMQTADNELGGDNDRPSEQTQAVDPEKRTGFRRAAGFTMAGFALGTVMTILITKLMVLDRPPAFVESVSQYQSLYQRDTVSQAKPDRVAVKKMMQQVFDVEIEIPDFSEHGFAFKRGQLLQINGKPLVQLVYLGDRGAPLAFCITPVAMKNNADTPSPTLGTSHGLDYGYWHQSGLGFVVAGDPTHSISALANTALSAVGI